MQTIRGPEDFAAAFGVPPETVERLVLYERLLRQWQKAVNLVASSTVDAVWHRHFADSAQLIALAPSGVRSWIDLGSGGGFPGMVAAIMMVKRATPSLLASPPSTALPSARREGWGEGQSKARTSHGQVLQDGHSPASAASFASPHPGPLPASGERGFPRFTLIESDARKCAFLREVARQTETPVDILSKRAESAKTSVNEDLPRVVSARALAPLDRLLDLAAPLSPPGTTLLFLKGKGADKEVQMAESRWRFQVSLVSSATDRHGRIAVVTNLERKAKD